MALDNRNIFVSTTDSTLWNLNSKWKPGTECNDTANLDCVFHLPENLAKASLSGSGVVSPPPELSWACLSLQYGKRKRSQKTVQQESDVYRVWNHFEEQ